MSNDPKELLKEFYSPSARQPQILTIPPMAFLMIDGHGDPNTSKDYTTAISALYTLAYTLKFGLKGSGTPDFKVFPLQGLWWAADMNAFVSGEKSAWDWTMMIAQPDWVSPKNIADAKVKAAAKVGKAVLDKVRFETYDEGLVVQLLHIGPYSAEGPNIARMHAFAKDMGYQLSGKHHEIYMGNPQRSAPEKLKTIIRQPIRK